MLGPGPRNVVLITLLVAAAQCLGVLGPRAAAAQAPAVADVGDTVARIGQYVRDYFARAQSVVAHEQITLQPIQRGFTPDGFARVLEYETRFEWDPTGEDGKGAATVVRELIKASGPTFGNQKGKDCFDPGPVSPEAMTFLLPGQHDDIKFTNAREARLKGQSAIVVDFRSVSSGPSSSTMDEKTGCGTMTVGGRVAGRVWVDPDDYAVMRVQQGLSGPVDIPLPPDQPRLGAWFTMVRSDYSIDYKPASFVDPDEVWLLPSEIVHLTFTEGSSVTSRMRITQRFSNYRRYVTGSRLVVE